MKEHEAKMEKIKAEKLEEEVRTDASHCLLGHCGAGPSTVSPLEGLMSAGEGESASG